MIGQGSPFGPNTIPRLRPCSILAYVILSYLITDVSRLERQACAEAAPGPPPVRIRVTWGDGIAKNWQGSLEAEDGELARLQHFPSHQNAIGSVWLDRSMVRIDQRTAVLTDTFEIDVTASPSGTLNLSLEDRTSGTKHSVKIPMRRLEGPRAVELFTKPNEFLNKRGESFSQRLDDTGNRIEIRRVDTARIRVEPRRTSLIFHPGEAWYPNIRFFLVLGSRASMRLTAGFRTQSGQIVSAITPRNLEANTEGHLVDLPDLPLQVPVEEGVYQFFVELERSTLGMGTNLIRRRVVARQQFDLVVIDRNRPDDGSRRGGMTVEELDPVNPDWVANIRRRARISIPGVRTTQPPAVPQVVELQGRNWQSLDERGWQAYPLRKERQGIPHVLEIQYPTGQAQTLGIAIVESDDDGANPVVLAESCIETPQRLIHLSLDSEPRIGKHELVYWPTNRELWLVLVNRGQRAAFGKVRIQEYADGLPLERNIRANARLTGTFLNEPHLPSLFGLRERDDWQAHLAASSQLVEYARFAGHNTIVLPWLSESAGLCSGDAIPSLIRGGPNGSLRNQQPIPKDVAELVYRQCDRSELQFVLAIGFHSYLPHLERLRRAASTEISMHPEDGRAGDRYNPLDKRVQEQMVTVVREIAERYGDHPSFGGVMIMLSPEGYAHFPDELAGLNLTTFRRFADTMRVQRSLLRPDADGERRSFVQGAGREAWLQWRCQEIAQLYRQMNREVASVRQSRLFLSPHNLLTEARFDALSRPDLIPDPEAKRDALRALGFDMDLLSQIDGLWILDAQPVDANLGDHALRLGWQAPKVTPSNLSQPDRTDRATLFVHASQAVEIPQLPVRSGFTTGATPVALQMPASPAGLLNRRRITRVLARADSEVLFDGGQTIPQGATHQNQSILCTYRQLPVGQFESVRVMSGSDQETEPPLQLRMLKTGRTTYMYAVNDSPLDIWLHAGMQTPPDATFSNLPKTRPDGRGARFDTRENITWWTVHLAPYDLAAITIDTSDVRVRATQFKVTDSEKVQRRLQTHFAEVENRMAGLGEKIDFEIDNLDSWSLRTGAKGDIRLDRDPLDATNQALRLQMASERVAITTPPLSLPDTGWISIRAKVFTNLRGGPTRLMIWTQASSGSDEVTRRRTIQIAKSGWHAIDELLFPDLTGNEATRVGIELQTPGSIWVDDLNISSFTEKEQTQLLKLQNLAFNLLRKDRLIECARVLDGYWPRFLLTELPEHRPRIAIQPEHADGSQGVRTAEDSKGWWPRIPRLFDYR